MVPLAGLLNPETRLRRVDFPQPLGPTIDRNFPVGTSNETSCTAV
jgi:hypothetical protein